MNESTERPQPMRPAAVSGSDLEKEIESLLNKHSAENDSDTPDFILAGYLMGCLVQWNESVRQREKWYGRGPKVCGPPKDELEKARVG